MPSLLKSTMNTRALPGMGLRFVRSDCPGNLSDDEVRWLSDNNIKTIIDLREEREYIPFPCRLENENGFRYIHIHVTEGGICSEIFKSGIFSICRHA